MEGGKSTTKTGSSKSYARSKYLVAPLEHKTGFVLEKTGSPPKNLNKIGRLIRTMFQKNQNRGKKNNQNFFLSLLKEIVFVNQAWHKKVDQYELKCNK